MQLLTTTFLFCRFHYLKAANQVDNAVLPLPPVKIDAAAVESAMKEETLIALGAEVSEGILPSETADV